MLKLDPKHEQELIRFTFPELDAPTARALWNQGARGREIVAVATDTALMALYGIDEVRLAQIRRAMPHAPELVHVDQPDPE